MTEELEEELERIYEEWTRAALIREVVVWIIEARRARARIVELEAEVNNCMRREGNYEAVNHHQRDRIAELEDSEDTFRRLLIDREQRIAELEEQNAVLLRSNEVMEVLLRDCRDLVRWGTYRMQERAECVARIDAALAGPSGE